MRSIGAGIRTTPESIDVRFRFRASSVGYAPALVASAPLLYRGEYIFVGVIWGALVLFVLGRHLFVRLRADRTGIRISNWVGRVTATWPDVVDLECVRSMGSPTIRIKLKDGRTVTAGYWGNASYAHAERIV